MTIEVGQNLGDALTALAVAFGVVGVVWGLAWSTREPR